MVTFERIQHKERSVSIGISNNYFKILGFKGIAGNDLAILR